MVSGKDAIMRDLQREGEGAGCHFDSRRSPWHVMKFCLPPSGIRSATSTTIDFGANCPFTFVPAYCLPVYASQSPLPDTTQDSVRGCRLSFTAVAISGDMVSCAFKAQPAQ